MLEHALHHLRACCPGKRRQLTERFFSLRLRCFPAGPHPHQDNTLQPDAPVLDFRNIFQFAKACNALQLVAAFTFFPAFVILLARNGTVGTAARMGTAKEYLRLAIQHGAQISITASRLPGALIARF